jgi:phosphopantetheinyl transferase
MTRSKLPTPLAEFAVPTSQARARVRVYELSAGLERTEILRSAIAVELGVLGEQVTLSADTHGRPMVRVSGGESSAVGLSVSHREQFVAVGLVDRGRVGVDIEIVTPGLDAADATIALSASERALLQSMPPDERRDGGYAMWTAKEALAKALGLGLSADLAGLEIERAAPDQWSIRTIHGSRNLALAWHLHHRRITTPTCRLIVAVAIGWG